MDILVLDNKQLETQVESLKKHLERNEEGLLVFIEVTNKKVTSQFTNGCLFIDPQHTGVGTNNLIVDPSKSAVKWTLDNHLWLSNILPGRDILYILEKIDMDSLASLVLCQWIEQEGADLEISNETEERLLSIHEVDTFVVPTEWNPDYIRPYEVKWTNILGASISDWKQSIETRVGYMLDYLIDGHLQEYYRKEVEKEWQLLQQATVEEIEGITVVTSQARGASGIIYSKAPFGIAYCPNFNGKGPKYSIMQFKSGYLKLHTVPAVVGEEGNVIKEAEIGFFDYMNLHHPQESGTFGGGPNAGGSPIPCELSKEVVAKELAKFVIKKV